MCRRFESAPRHYFIRFNLCVLLNAYMDKAVAVVTISGYK